MFNGVVFRGQDVVGIMRWMYFGFPLKWFMNALCFTVFTPSVYSGVALCNYTSNMDAYNASVFDGVHQAVFDAQTAGAAAGAAGAQLAVASAATTPDTALIASLSATLAEASANATRIGGWLAELGANPTNFTMPTPYAPAVDLIFTSVDNPQVTLGLDGYQEMMVSSLGCFRGFYCPNASDPLQCFGATGPEILSTLNANFESISDIDDRPLDVTVMLFLAAAFKIMHALFVLLDINTRVMIRDFLNLNAPGLVIVCTLIVTAIALAISGQAYGPIWL